MRTQDFTDDEERARKVLETLLGRRGMRVATLARAVGLKHQTVWDKVTGRSRLGITDMCRFAEVLGVEPLVFFMDPDEAVQWDLDQRRQTSPATAKPSRIPSSTPAANAERSEGEYPIVPSQDARFRLQIIHGFGEHARLSDRRAA